MTDIAIGDDAVQMDRHYRYQRFIYDSTRAHYLLGRKYLLADLKPSAGQSVIEIGCGTAWNLASAAHLYPEAKLYGVDVSRAMLQTAAASMKRKNLAQHIVLRQGDAMCFDPQKTFGLPSFDRVILSYTLSMMPGWKLALEHASNIVAPGGSVHVVDFGQCEGLSKTFKNTFFSFLAYYAVTPRTDMKRHLGEVAERFGYKLHFEHLHRGYTNYGVLNRADGPVRQPSHLFKSERVQL